jgi:hypothetical protein
LGLADFSAVSGGKGTPPKVGKAKEEKEEELEDQENRSGKSHGATTMIAPGLHYNIQIHLPASKDIEVYNSIFKALKEHLFED